MDQNPRWPLTLDQVQSLIDTTNGLNLPKALDAQHALTVAVDKGREAFADDTAFVAAQHVVKTFLG